MKELNFGLGCQRSASGWICMPTVGTSLKSRLFWTCLHIKGWRNKAGAVQQRLINQPLNHLGPNKEFKWASEQRDKKKVKSHNQFQRPVTCTTKECKFMYVCFPSSSLLLTFTLPPYPRPLRGKERWKDNSWTSDHQGETMQAINGPSVIENACCALVEWPLLVSDTDPTST